MKKFNFSKGLVIGLLTLALCLTCFAAAKVSAEDAAAETIKEVKVQYDCSDNTIYAASEFVAYVMKGESGTIKGGATGVAAAKGDDDQYRLGLDKLGVKGTTKDVYLYTVSGKIKEDTEATANMVILAQAAKKIVGTINYTKIDAPCVSGIIGATVTDADKAAITGFTLLWSKDDKTYAVADYIGDGAETAANYNDDFTVNTDEDSTAPEAMQAAFSSGILKSMLKSGGTIYVKMQGVSGASGKAQFSSKAVKVKVTKQAKAPAIKLDIKKQALSLKNGFDFAIAEYDEENKTYSVETWYTILPVLKDAETDTADASIVETASYKPLNKKDDNAKAKLSASNTTVAYTSYKFKNLPIDANGQLEDLFACGGYLAVRKSATDKKPASDVSYTKVNAIAPAPLVYTKEKVAGEYLVATAEDFTKGFVLGAKIVNYPGKVMTNKNTEDDPSDDETVKEVATNGFWNNFEILSEAEADGEYIVDADKAAASYEYLVVNASDYTGDKIDWTTAAWKKFDTAKTKISAKLKSKYYDKDGNKIDAVLDTTAGSATFDPSKKITDNKISTLLLIRRAGVKGKTVAATVLGSEEVALYLIESGDNIYVYSVADIGEEAVKYSIDFAKYKAASGTGANALAAGFYVDDSIASITGWVAKARSDANSTLYFEYPELTGAEYWATALVDSVQKTKYYTVSSKLTPAASGENEGKYALAITNSSGDNAETAAVIAIREYANVNIEAQFVTISGSKETVVSDLDAVELGFIEGGKKASLIVDEEDAEKTYLGIADNASLDIYVGQEFTYALPITVDAEYELEGYKVLAKNYQPSGYPKASAGTYDADTKSLKATVATAEEAITIKFVVAPVYTITFDANGGEYPEAKTTVEFTTGTDGTLTTASVNAAGNITPPVGKEFDSWNTKADGKGTKVTDLTKAFTANQTLYAIYTTSQYTITIVNEDGFTVTGIKNGDKVDHGSNIEFTINSEDVDVAITEGAASGGQRINKVDGQTTVSLSGVVKDITITITEASE